MDKIKRRLDTATEEPAKSEMPDKLMENRPTCILRARNVVGDKIDASVPEGCFRVPRGREGKVIYSLFHDDPWYVLVAHKLLGIYLKFFPRK